MIVTVTLNAAIDKRYVIDKLEPGTVMRVKECRYSAGGKGLNVSRVAALAGEKVVATGIIAGHSGEFVIQQLMDMNIDSQFLKVDGESRSCINIHDQATGMQTELLEPGVNVTDEQVEQFVHIYSGVIKNCSVVSISGSVPQGVDHSVYPRLIEIAKAMGKKVILDTSGKLLEAGIRARPDMIKPNQDEIKALLGTDIVNRQQLIAAAKQLHEDGVAIVVISLGEDGAVVVCDEGVYLGKLPSVPVQNTVGCGDAMVAAFAVGLARHADMRSTLEEALAISAANAMHKDTGYYLQQDYDKLRAQVSVTSL